MSTFETATAPQIFWNFPPSALVPMWTMNEVFTLNEWHLDFSKKAAAKIIMTIETRQKFAIIPPVFDKTFSYQKRCVK